MSNPITRSIILICFIWLAYLLLTTHVYADIRVCQRSEFTHCLAGPDSFVSKQTNFTYTNLFGSTTTEKVDRVVGCLSPNLEACSLSALRNDADFLPTANLAAQHFWLVFNLQQMAQSELMSCYAEYNAQLKLLKIPCMVTDESCSSAAAIINGIGRYWIEFNAPEGSTWWKTQPATRENYIFHFKTGIDGLDRILQHREYCRNVALPKAVAAVKSKYRIK